MSCFAGCVVVKIRIPNEIVYLAAICCLALAVAMVASAGFGMSMIVAPAYVLSRRFTALTFGQTEYVVQACLFVVLCVAVGGFRVVFLSAFANCMVYGAVLDFLRFAVPVLNPRVTPVGSLPFAARVCLFAAGLVLTGASVAVFYKTYMYPQVYDFFVRAVSGHFGIKRLKFKYCFDFACLFTATALSLLFFGRLVGIGVGTLIVTCTMGLLIEFFCSLYDKFFDFVPYFSDFAEKFDLKAK